MLGSLLTAIGMVKTIYNMVNPVAKTISGAIGTYAAPATPAARPTTVKPAPAARAQQPLPSAKRNHGPGGYYDHVFYRYG